MSQKRSERGFVVVLFALGCVAFLSVMGFGVDLGTWYLKAQRLQRAADAAALAGAERMPDAGAADSFAKATAIRNGFDPANSDLAVATGPVAGSDSRYRATIRDTRVPTFFGRVFGLDTLSIGRTAEADRTFFGSKMGSPWNGMGMGNIDLRSPANPDTPLQNYWMAVNGPCSDRERGDAFLSKFKDNDLGATNDCSGAWPATPNQDYNPNGYSFIIEVPPSAAANGQDAIFKLWDPFYYEQNINAAAAGANWSADASFAHDADSDTAKASPTDAGKFNTRFTLKQIPSLRTPVGGGVLRGNDVFGTVTAPDRGSAATVNSGGWYDSRGVGFISTNDGTWVTVRSSDLTPGQPSLFRLTVTTECDSVNDPSCTRAYGANSFGIVAKLSGTNGMCNWVKNPSTCPKVYAENYASTINNGQGRASDQVPISFAQVPAGTPAGTPVQISLFDPGEGYSSLRLVAPKSTSTFASPQYDDISFTYKTFPRDVTYDSTIPTTSIDVSDALCTGAPNCVQPFNRPAGPNMFNNRRIVINATVPAGYNPPADNDFWSIVYTLKSASAYSIDRITWGAKVGSGKSPVHLVTPSS